MINPDDDEPACHFTGICRPHDEALGNIANCVHCGKELELVDGQWRPWDEKIVRKRLRIIWIGTDGNGTQCIECKQEAWLKMWVFAMSFPSGRVSRKPTMVLCSSCIEAVPVHKIGRAHV